ncbi:MAG: rRNA adenine N-6-methyltransferase family protein [Bacteroidota bacterium]
MPQPTDQERKDNNFAFMSGIVKRFDELKYALLDAQTFDPEHYGFPDFYYEVMETDHKRVEAFRKAFEKYDQLKDKVVCEIGVGTLALTKHFLPHVKKAYLIESNPNVIAFVEDELKKNGWTDKVTLIHGDALKTELPEPVDFVIGELMSIFCANELQVQIFRHARKFLSKDGVLMPERIHNMAQLCYSDFDHGHDHYPVFFTRHLPEIFCPMQLINTIDLYQEEEMHIHRRNQFQPMLSGKVNAVYLNSWIQVAEGCNFTGTDSLMPPTVVKLREAVEVKAGESYTLHSDYQYGTSLDQASFWLS